MIKMNSPFETFEFEWDFNFEKSLREEHVIDALEQPFCRAGSVEPISNSHKCKILHIPCTGILFTIKHVQDITILYNKKYIPKPQDYLKRVRFSQKVTYHIYEIE